MADLPFDFVSPVGGRHFPLRNIFSVASLKACPLFFHAFAFAFLGFSSGAGPLFTKPNGLDFAAFLGNNDVRFLGVAWRSLGLVDARNTGSFDSGRRFLGG